MMKWLKLVGLGMAIWSLSLLWPDINLGFTPTMMMASGSGLAAAALVYRLGRHFNQRPQPKRAAGNFRPSAGVLNVEQLLNN